MFDGQHPLPSPSACCVAHCSPFLHTACIPFSATDHDSSLTIDSLFYDYTIQSRSENNTINLELPLAPLQAALKSASNATSASLRLTKRDGDAILSLTIITQSVASGSSANGFLRNRDDFGDDDFYEQSLNAEEEGGGPGRGVRETVVTQEIPIRILSAASVEGIHEPRVREPDVHILLPPLLSLKAISDRFTKLAIATSGEGRAKESTRLELLANMHGSLKMRAKTDSLSIESVWRDLSNPDLDPEQVVRDEGNMLPSEVMRAKGEDAWATVRIDGRDWGRVLSVGRLGGKVIACK